MQWIGQHCVQGRRRKSCSSTCRQSYKMDRTYHKVNIHSVAGNRLLITWRLLMLFCQFLLMMPVNKIFCLQNLDTIITYVLEQYIGTNNQNI